MVSDTEGESTAPRFPWSRVDKEIIEAKNIKLLKHIFQSK